MISFWLLLLAFRFQLSVLSSQFSVFSFQFSVFSFQFSVPDADCSSEAPRICHPERSEGPAVCRLRPGPRSLKKGLARGVDPIFQAFWSGYSCCRL